MNWKSECVEFRTNLRFLKFSFNDIVWLKGLILGKLLTLILFVLNDHETIIRIYWEGKCEKAFVTFVNQFKPFMF